MPFLLGDVSQHCGGFTSPAPSVFVTVCSKLLLSSSGFKVCGFGGVPFLQRLLCIHTPGCCDCPNQGISLITLAGRESKQTTELCAAERGELSNLLDLMPALSNPAHSRNTHDRPGLTLEGRTSVSFPAQTRCYLNFSEGPSDCLLGLSPNQSLW